MKDKEHCISPEELSAYLDADLEPTRQAGIERHLGSCADCQGVLGELRALKSNLPELADVEPRRDLWPAIQRAHASREPIQVSWWRRFWMVPVAAAAGAAVAILLVLVVGRRVSEAPSKPVGPVQALQAVARAEVEYRNAIGALEQALTQGRPEWSPETRKVVEQGLAEIDGAIDRCRAALKQDPANLEAQEAVLAAYQNKVDFMMDLVSESLSD